MAIPLPDYGSQWQPKPVRPSTHLKALVLEALGADGQRRRHLLDQEIPDEMLALRGIQEFDLGGVRVSLKLVAQCALRVGRESEGKEWLKEQGFKGAPNARRLGTFLRQRVKAGKSVPKKLFRVSIHHVARISKLAG